MAKIKDNQPKHHKHRHVAHKPKSISRDKFEKAYWPYLPVAFLVVGMGLLYGLSHQFTGQSKPSVLSYATEISVKQLLQNTNIERNSVSLDSLTINDTLSKAAQAKADDMVKRNYWSHYTPDGYAPWVFISAAGYNYQKVGENLAAGFSDSDSAISGWMASATHKANILDSTYTEAGFGFADSASFKATGNKPTTVVVAFYGRPAGVSSGSVKSSTSCAGKTDYLGLCSTPASEVSSSSTTESKSIPISKFQVALSNTPIAVSGAAAIVFLSIFIIIWLARHAYGIKKAISNGERYVIKHPAMDLAFVAIFIVGFLFAQTAGLIK